MKSNVFNVLDHINGNSMHDVVNDALYTCGDVVLKALGMGYFLNATAFCHICPSRNPSFLCFPNRHKHSGQDDSADDCELLGIIYVP